jgi:hypothetical protein
MAEQPQQKTPAQDKPKTVFVLSRFDSIHTIGIGQHGDVRLMPGVNEVPTDQWEKAADPKSHVTQHHIKTKRIQVLRSGDLPEDEEKALELVQATIKDTILRAWQKHESRAAVLDAIEDQLKAIRGEKARREPNGPRQEA